MIALICFFPVLVTTVDGLAAVDPDQLKLLRTLDASRWQAFRFAELPAALPAAISGARIALAVGRDRRLHRRVPDRHHRPYAGLGREIDADLNALQTSRAYAAAVVLFVFAIACFYTLALVERRLAPWAHRSRGDTPLRTTTRRDLATRLRADHVGVRRPSRTLPRRPRSSRSR